MPGCKRGGGREPETSKGQRQRCWSLTTWSPEASATLWPTSEHGLGLTPLPQEDWVETREPPKKNSNIDKRDYKSGL